MAENQGRYLDGIEQILQLPEVLLGGNLEDKKFQVFPKSALLSAIATVAAQRKSAIRISGVTGNVIIHEDLVGRQIGSMVINDILRNTNYIKGNNDDVNSDQVVLTDNFQCTPEMWITINLI